ncbi:heavy-metal-associated domain-containing protein [Cuneatibacter sp. NSJ-177]|uniref:heavy-metal-associated domain-containing protein n=1 Tax=Cuneatibacter sp. NSJ-177 TaxID=2931401 RepID=UPI001FD23670|nr:heavy metal-associated domain-containing protein [Cuneatibacter sp. NSJ-177]MCJ7836188.1 heavy-metal-associated domain-containing protein [Cuneatibacter sp. NSJ-177]
MSTVIICAALVLICVFSVRSYLKKMKHGCCGAGGYDEKKIRPKDRELSHYSYARRIQIEGMSCKNCAIRIANAFHERDGFYAEVNQKEGFALVRMKKRVSDEELRKIIAQAGYRAIKIDPAGL